MQNFEKLSDKELYEECRKWGSVALEARRKFAGLLPEVQRRRLYEKKGFSSIFEFAARMAGMSRDQVNRVFCVDKKLEDKPLLRKLLIQGEVSVNKLSRITSIATSENQLALSEKVQNLSNRAIEVFVKDCKKDSRIDSPNSKTENQDGLCEPTEDVHVHVEDPDLAVVHKIDEPNFDFKIINAMSPELKKKIGELIERGHDINRILLEMLSEREAEIESQIEKIGQEVHDEESEKFSVGIPQSRYIKVKITRVLEKKFGKKCGVAGCGRPAAEIHHERLFSKFGTHDPRFLKPLCKAHHEIAHEKDAFVRRYRRE